MTKEAIMKNNKSIAIFLMLVCTFCTAAGQVFWKLGSENFSFDLLKIITNYYVVLGFVFYFLASILLMFALKKGDLSFLFPFASLSFIWVTLLSIFIFHDAIEFMNFFGIFFIFVGVGLISRGSK